MDIRAYFRKVREAELSIGPESVVMVSNDTPDGGKAGRLVEVGRGIAAKMIVSGSARLATDVEAREFREQAAREMEQALAEQEASRVRLMVTTDRAERLIRPTLKPKG